MCLASGQGWTVNHNVAIISGPALQTGVNFISAAFVMLSMLHQHTPKGCWGWGGEGPQEQGESVGGQEAKGKDHPSGRGSRMTHS